VKSVKSVVQFFRFGALALCKLWIEVGVLDPTLAGVKGESQLFLLLRVNLLNSWRRLKSLHKTSGFMAAAIVLFVVSYQTLSFALFWHGFKFANSFPALGELLVERLFFLLFAFLLVLLLFSNLVIGYGNFFRNRETQFLSSLPIPDRVVFQWKFIESTVLASWAFLFLIAPLLAAYGLSRGVPWYFYVMTGVSIALFIVLPAAAGAWVALALARFLDRRVFQLLALGALAVLLPLLVIWFRPQVMPESSTDTRVLSNLDMLLTRTRFAEWPWLPSFWLSTGVIQWADGALASAVFFFLVLLSHVLFFASFSFACAGRIFHESFSIVQSRDSIFVRWAWFKKWRERSRRFDYRIGPMERAFRLLFRPPSDALALMVKDARMFWRDTAQWGQTLVLLGLLAVYIINLRHFSEEMTNPFWAHLICYLNLGACALNLATLTTRFVYPQFSMEGKRLWIIGMAPMGLGQVLRVKLWLASRAALLVSLGLIFLSCRLLRIPLDHTLYLGLIIGAMTFTLAALAMGLSALFPNFREENPAKIVSGFGGTFCLVASFLYIVASVTLLAMGSPWGWRGATSVGWILGSWAGFAALSVAVGWVPLRLGLRRLERFEV
jgi:ABC-2 type transport system permease protein